MFENAASQAFAMDRGRNCVSQKTQNASRWIAPFEILATGLGKPQNRIKGRHWLHLRCEHGEHFSQQLFHHE